MVKLSKEQLERYSRNISLERVGTEGQEKLLESKVLVVGLGGLGSPASLYLAAAGVGTVGLIDSDCVELSNLQRQILHDTGDIDVEKTKSAKEKIKALNPDVTVKAYQERATAENIRGIVRQYDFVIEATDNFESKFLINDACYFEKKAFSHAGILAFFGQTITVVPGESACYRCLFNSVPPDGAVPTTAQLGVFGAVPGVLGSIQATEAVKYILGLEGLLTDTLLTYDALDMEFSRVNVKRNPDCSICGKSPRITELGGDE